MIREYETYWRRRKPAYRILSWMAIGLAATTPILAAARLPEWAIAIPAGLSALAGAAVAVSQWQETIARSGYTAEALKCELAKYLTKTRPYQDSSTALGEFVRAITDIRMGEVMAWQKGSRPTPDGRESSGGAPDLE